MKIKNIKFIELDNLELKTFTEQNVLDYCLLNNINPDNIEELWLSNNELTDISGIKLFKNVNILEIDNNKIEDISAVIKNLNNLNYLNISNNKIVNITILKDLNKLEYLDIGYLELESDQIEYIKSLKKLKTLYCRKGFKDMSVLNKLNKKINIKN